MERDARIQHFEQTWNATLLSPVAGYGIGSYESTFPMFADLRTGTIRKTHNDWLEMMFTLGIPAAMVWFAVLAGLAGRCLAGVFARRRDHVYPAVGFCALVLVGMHALVDFSLQIPGVAVRVAVVVGVGQGRGLRAEGQGKSGEGKSRNVNVDAFGG